MDDTAIVVLAGGNATRFPGKLVHPIDGVPMVVRVVRNVRALQWPIYVAGRGDFSAEILAELDAPMLLDDRPGAGPLAALLSASRTIGAGRIAAVAADAPRVDAALFERLTAAWQPGDEAVVPKHEGRIEPLAAIYATDALQREGGAVALEGNASMHALIDRLRARFVTFPSDLFLNVNYLADVNV